MTRIEGAGVGKPRRKVRVEPIEEPTRRREKEKPVKMPPVRRKEPVPV